MYNKLFTKILDSSIWLTSTPTRIVWMTFLAAMDEKGFARFAAVGNLAHRARVTLDEARTALDTLEGPDPESSDPENEGRRIERVPGGWVVLNAGKHRELITRAIQQAQTAERVRRYRALKRTVTHLPHNVTHTEAYTEAGTETKAEAEAETKGHTPQHVGVQTDPRPPKTALAGLADFPRFWAIYPNKKGKGAALKAWQKLAPSESLTTTILAALARQQTWPEWTKDGGQFIPHPATWLNRGSWDDEPASPSSHGLLISDKARQNVAAGAIAIARIQQRETR